MRKTILFILLIFSASIFSINCQTKTSAEKVKPCKYLSFDDAEKILGQKVELITNSWNFADGKTIFRCNYRAIEEDQASGKDVNLFFMLEEDSTEEEAKQIYEEIWNLNKDHQGIEVLSGIGDEAYSHSEKPNFHFVMVRKGKFTVRFKINKAVETTSLEALKAFSKKIINEL